MFVSRFSDIWRKTLVHLCIVSLIQTPKLIVTSWSILLCYNSLWYTVMWQFCCFVSWSLPTFLLEFLLSAVLSELPLILCFFFKSDSRSMAFFPYQMSGFRWRAGAQWDVESLCELSVGVNNSCRKGVFVETLHPHPKWPYRYTAVFINTINHFITTLCCHISYEQE